MRAGSDTAWATAFQGYRNAIANRSYISRKTRQEMIFAINVNVSINTELRDVFDTQ
jgi:hypothetical protein